MANLKDMPKNVGDTTTGFEIPIVYRVCYACGFNERIDIVEEDTPAKTMYCPDCGHILNRLSGTEMFHLNFVSSLNALPTNIEVLPELPTRDIAPGNPFPPISDITFVQAEGKTFKFHGENLRARLLQRVESKDGEALRKVLSKATLLEVDSVPVRRLGVFGLSEGEFIEKVLTYQPVTLGEMKEHKISYLNDNNTKLRIKVDNKIVEFTPKEGFPFFTEQVAGTGFEDFIRQAKNLKGVPERMLAFAMSNGVSVHTEGVKPSTYPIRVKPSNFRTFTLMASVMNSKNIFWRGDFSFMKVKGSLEQIESIVTKIDPQASITEETVSGDINPGYVTREKKSKLHKWLSEFLKGKVIELESTEQNTFKFKLQEEESDFHTQKLATLKNILGDLTGSFEWDKGYNYTSGIKFNQVYLGEDLEVDESSFEVFFPEDMDEDIMKLLQEEYAYFKDISDEWLELFSIEEHEISEKVSVFFDVLADVISETKEELGEEEFTKEMFTAILNDFRDGDEIEMQLVNYIVDRPVPDYVSAFILSDMYSIPSLELQTWYDEFAYADGETTDVETELPDDVDVDVVDSAAFDVVDNTEDLD